MKSSPVTKVPRDKSGRFLPVKRLYTETDRTFFLPLRLRLGDSSMEEPYAQHAWVYGAVSAKASNIAGVPFVVYEVSPDEKEIRPVNRDHLLQKLFLSPNPNFSQADFFEGISILLDLYGEAIILLIGNLSGGYKVGEIPREMWLLPPDVMTEIVKKGVIVAWEVETEGGRKEIIEADRVIHIKEFNPYDRHRGLGPMQAATLGARTDRKIGQLTEALMDNGADPGGVLHTEGDLDDDEIKRIKSEWYDQHRGILKRGRLAILKGGLKYQQITFNARDMEFPKLREWSREEILAVFHTPKLEVGLIDDVNRATAQVTKKLFWQNVLVPRLNKIVHGFWRALFKPINEASGKSTVLRGRFVLETVDALRPEFSEQLDHAIKLKALGYALNQIKDRLNLGMPDVPWGNEPLSETKLVPIMELYKSPGKFLPQKSPPSAKLLSRIQRYWEFVEKHQIQRVKNGISPTVIPVSVLKSVVRILFPDALEDFCVRFVSERHSSEEVNEILVKDSSFEVIKNEFLTKFLALTIGHYNKILSIIKKNKKQSEIINALSSFFAEQKGKRALILAATVEGLFYDSLTANFTKEAVLLEK